MKILKHFVFILLIISTGTFLVLTFKAPIEIYTNRLLYFSFCEKPVLYRVGTVDPKFGLTKNQFETLIKEGALIWKSAYTKELFAFDPNAKLTINLVYDERQSLITKIGSASEQVDLQKKKITEGLDSFDKKKKELMERIEELNNQIAYWNNKGGAPEEEYEKIKTEQKQIQKEVDELNKEAENLNKNTNELNSGIGSLNNNVNTFNQLLSTKPEEGLYIPLENKIDIYIYTDDKQLIHTIAHELGHSLGLGHIEDRGALMNPVASEDIALLEADKKLLTQHCSEQNRLLLIKNDLKYFLEFQIKKWNKKQA